MHNKIKKHPYVSSVASLLIGFGAVRIYDYSTKVPASTIGIVGVDTNLSDKNGDGIPDAMVTTSDGYNHLTLGRGNGLYIGLKGLEKEFKDAEAGLNHDLSGTNKYIPTFRGSSKQPQPPQTSEQPKEHLTFPKNTSQRDSLPSSDSYPEVNGRTASNNSRGLEGKTFAE